MEKLPARNIITDKLVIGLTGETMAHWYAVLDAAGAKNLSHTEIFSLVGKTAGLRKLGVWNQNLFITSYEWDRGLKQRGQKENGFEISVSKTVALPLTVLYDVFINEVKRKKWLPENDIKISKATANKSVRALWSDGNSRISIDFYVKGPHKSQVVVQHMKLPDPEKAAAMKIFRRAALKKLLLFSGG